jgi:hypothetical protein
MSVVKVRAAWKAPISSAGEQQDLAAGQEHRATSSRLRQALPAGDSTALFCLVQVLPD